MSYENWRWRSEPASLLCKMSSKQVSKFTQAFHLATYNYANENIKRSQSLYDQLWRRGRLKWESSWLRGRSRGLSPCRKSRLDAHTQLSNIYDCELNFYKWKLCGPLTKSQRRQWQCNNLEQSFKLFYFFCNVQRNENKKSC